MTHKEENELKMAILRADIEVAELEQKATGRTTRAIDYAIQKLFRDPDKWIVVSDHWPTKQAQEQFLRRLKDRLKYEHNIEIETRHDFGMGDHETKIRLKNYKAPNFEREINEIRERQAVWKHMLEDGIHDKFE